MDYKPPIPKKDYKDGQDQEEPSPTKEDLDLLWEEWQISIQPMLKQIDDSRIVTGKDLAMRVH